MKINPTNPACDTLPIFSASRAHRKFLPLLLAACLSAAGIGTALANPTGPVVVNGQATFSQQGNVFSIANSPNTIINWSGFSIQQGEITRFIQESSNSSVLNRITGQDPSRIMGALQSNGRVFLINPNGILFGSNAQVNVNGLVASSLAISNADFLSGKNKFAADAVAGDVINLGAITTPSGGQVMLIAPNVGNSGIITSPQGEVLLAAGQSVQLADSTNPGMHVVVSAPADQAINLGTVIAQGGAIGIYGALVNQRGTLNANSATVGENGKIILKASRTTLLEAGSVTTATGAGIGGEIQLLGEQVGLLGNARVDADGQNGGGTVLIGGDYQGKNPSVMNAQQVYVGKDAKISANAVLRGNGGKVIVWGDRTAQVFGTISARGGMQSGNGGFIETSGHFLDVAGIRVNAGAPNGQQGKWLLDPYNIYVAVAGDSVPLSDVNAFATPSFPGDTSFINAPQISDAIADVILQATHDITFAGAINIAAAGVGLTAQAGNDINVLAPITTNGGALTLSANDNGGGTASGVGKVNVNAALTTNGGSLTLKSAVPSLASCIATPTAPGCSAVLPSMPVCIASPSTAGCSVVLPTLPSCAANPSLPGCSAVLPSLTSCIANPFAAGCVVVLPTLSSCIANPFAAGCVVVLPALSSCIANPFAAGCVAVLPALSSCIANPSRAGCFAVLPTMSSCVINASLPGCSAVLPTLAACIANPFAAGCSVILPTLSSCVVNPSFVGCVAVLPPTQSEPANPVAQAINSTVNVTNTAGTASPASDTKKEDAKQDTLVAKDSGVKKNEPAKKMYCN